MKLSDAFPSNYLKADDLCGADATYTIQNVTQETLGSGRDAQTKLVLHFHESEKSMVLNKTNANSIAKVLSSDDTDHWRGRQITIYPAEVEFQGETMLGLRVRLLSRPSPSVARPAHSGGGYESLPSQPAVPPRVASTSGADVNAAKLSVREAMIAKMPGQPIDAVYAAIKASVETVYPGRAIASLGVVEWRRLIELDFAPSFVPSQQEDTFDADSIPF